MFRRFDLETKRQYEVVFIVDPTVDDEVARLTDNFKQVVTDQGGVVTKAETMGKRQLAYEILHQKDGGNAIQKQHSPPTRHAQFDDLVMNVPAIRPKDGQPFETATDNRQDDVNNR